MRAFLSLLLVLTIISTVLLLFSIYQRIKMKIFETEYETLLLESQSARELELKRAMINSVVHAAREEAQKIDGIGMRKEMAKRLAELDSGLEKYYKEKNNIEIDFWCGTPSEEEIRKLPERLEKEGKVKPCPTCYDLNFPALIKRDSVEEATYICAALLDVDFLNNEVIISGPSQDVTAVWNPFEKPKLGVSIIDKRNGIYSVTTIPFNSKIKWSA